MAQYKRAKTQTKSRVRKKRSVLTKATCEGCEKEFSYVLYERSKPRRFCSKACYYAQREPKNLWQPRSAPNGKLSKADLAAIELIWHTYEFSPLACFFGERDVAEIYERISSKALFHEWAVYTIIFQAHLTYRYESIVQIPGLNKADFLGLCDRFNITLMDSEAFENDVKTVACGQ